MLILNIFFQIGYNSASSNDPEKRESGADSSINSAVGSSIPDLACDMKIFEIFGVAIGRKYFAEKRL
jgi:hypothetical protein